MRVTVLLAAILAVATAFAPAARAPRFARVQTAREFGFLKELGLEKPSWLPDFGGKKEEAAPEPEATPVAEDAPEGEPAPAEE